MSGRPTMTPDQMIAWCRKREQDESWRAARNGLPQGDREYHLSEAVMYDAIAQALQRAPAAPAWQPIETAPKDGTAFLAFGVHDHSPITAQRGVQAGDHWWSIVLWDIWRSPAFVFAKDGAATWSEPTHWMPLPAAPVAKDSAGSLPEHDPNGGRVENTNTRSELPPAGPSAQTAPEQGR